MRVLNCGAHNEAGGYRAYRSIDLLWTGIPRQDCRDLADGMSNHDRSMCFRIFDFSVAVVHDNVSIPSLFNDRIPCCGQETCDRAMPKRVARPHGNAQNVTRRRKVLSHNHSGGRAATIKDSGWITPTRMTRTSRLFPMLSGPSKAAR